MEITDRNSGNCAWRSGRSVTLLFTIGATAASAQSWDVMTPQLNTIESHRMINQIIENNKGRSGHDRPSQTAADVPARAFDFTPSHARREANLARLVDAMRLRDPAGAAALQDLFASTDIIAAIGQEIAPTGLTTTNLADAFALWWMTAWDAAHGTTRTPSRAMAQAVRRQAMVVMSTTADVANMSDANKQTMAEAYLIQAGLMAASVEQVAGDATATQEMMRAVSRSTKAAGMDLSKVTLTEEGFVPASRTIGANDAGVPGPVEPVAVAVSDGSALSPLLYAGAGAGVAALIFWAVRGRG